MRRPPAKALRLLRAARDEFYLDLSVNGEAETRVNPSLRKRERLRQQINAYLLAVETEAR